MLTFVIPVGPYHEAVAEEAVASCLTQSLRCEVVVVYDRGGRGAGWARNEGLKQVTTPFASFLDADDLLEPTFAEACLRAYDGRRYVYTDWCADGVVKAPCAPWSGDGPAHVVTTLLPTAFVRSVGGFDEQLPGGEDTDFYWKLTRNGLCGKRLPVPLVQYRKGGLRAQRFIDSDEYLHTMRGVVARYERLPMPCTDCGGNVLNINSQPLNAPEPGDVLAEALWAGERPERGMVSRRIYRGGWNSRLWMDPRDIDAAPRLFSRVIDMPGIPTEDDFQAFAMQAMHAMTGQQVQPKAKPAPVPVAYGTPGEVKPDLERVLRLYQNTQ